MKDIELKLKFKRDVCRNLKEDIETLENSLKIAEKWKPGAKIEDVIKILNTELQKNVGFIEKYNTFSILEDNEQKNQT